MKLCLYLCQTSFNNELTLRNGFTLIFTNMQGSSGTPKIRKCTSYLSPECNAPHLQTGCKHAHARPLPFRSVADAPPLMTSHARVSAEAELKDLLLETLNRRFPAKISRVLIMADSWLKSVAFNYGASSWRRKIPWVPLKVIRSNTTLEE